MYFKLILFFIIVTSLICLSVLSVFDNWVTRPGESRIPLAIEVSKVAAAINSSLLKFYQNNIEIRR